MQFFKQKKMKNEVAQKCSEPVSLRIHPGKSEIGPTVLSRAGDQKNIINLVKNINYDSRFMGAKNLT